MSLDPLAHKYSAWSSYNYVLGNPVSYFDTDGRYTRGDATTSLATFIKTLKLWEVEAAKYRIRYFGKFMAPKPLNHAKFRIFDNDKQKN